MRAPPPERSFIDGPAGKLEIILNEPAGDRRGITLIAHPHPLFGGTMLLFIPAVTGVMIHFERIGREWVAFLLAGIGGTAITLVVTAFTLRLLLARTKASPE